MVNPVYLLLAAMAVGLVAGADEVPANRELPRKIYAHYMACYPLAAKATEHHRRRDAHRVRHDGPEKFDPIGDRWRNWPLTPDGLALDLEASADLEIRRAMRAGIDGFAIDLWAGSAAECTSYIDALFAVAERHDYPFEITVCYDGGPLVEATRWLLDTHGDSPNLARRDGKPLVFGYHSARHNAAFALAARRDDPTWQGKDIFHVPGYRTTPEGWTLMADAIVDLEKQIGTDLYQHFCMAGFDHWLPKPQATEANYVGAARELASRGIAVGGFLPFPHMAAVAKAVREAGGEWCQPMFFQYENIHWGGNRIGNGADLLRQQWQLARDHDSRLIQFVTWNDYTENTMLAPGYDTRYAILDLNAWYIAWWKTGTPPPAERDKLYLLYRKYPPGASFFPFQAKQRDSGGVIEVISHLTAPGTIRLPGREAEYAAPAGMHHRQFPLTPGPVAAELVRDGEVVLRLASPEPITALPYREQNSMVAVSTEFQRHWEADFGPEIPPMLRGEYADDDGDGLPNWFEMYWFGKFLDWSTAVQAEPGADPDGDGKTNLEEFRERTDPIKPPPDP